MVVFKFLKEKILKQYVIGAWFGGVKDLFTRAQFYIMPLNLFMLAATTYQVTAKGFIHQFAPWFNFWLFFAAIILIAGGAMIFEYKFVYPSSITYSNLQAYKHGSLIRRDLERILQKLDQINIEQEEDRE